MCSFHFSLPSIVTPRNFIVSTYRIGVLFTVNWCVSLGHLFCLHMCILSVLVVLNVNPVLLLHVASLPNAICSLRSTARWSCPDVYIQKLSTYNVVFTYSGRFSVMLFIASIQHVQDSTLHWGIPAGTLCRSDCVLPIRNRFLLDYGSEVYSSAYQCWMRLHLCIMRQSELLCI